MRVLVFGGLALEEVIKADPRWRPTTEGVVAAGDGSPHRQRDCCGDPPHALRANPRPGGTSMLPENNNAVSCGAADGAIGGSVAKAFARSGARVLLAGRNRRGPVEVATVGSVGAANPAGVPRLGGGS
jgi:hypothetical protein